jgi:Spy/CpxP family protein refolding chaperone
MTATTAAAAETSDVTAAKAANATAATPAKTTDVTAAKAPAASSATTAATTTAAGIGSDGDEGHHEEQHRGNADAGLQHRLRITDIDQIRYYGRPLSRERMDAQGRTESS